MNIKYNITNTYNNVIKLKNMLKVELMIYKWNQKKDIFVYKRKG